MLLGGGGWWVGGGGVCWFFFFNDTATTEIYTLSLHDALPISGEQLWAMPMEPSYFDGLKSVVADMKNTGPRPGGAITASLFLEQFVETTPWAHIDVAGPVWTDGGSGINPAGATGFGVRTLVNWVLS